MAGVYQPYYGQSGRSCQSRFALPYASHRFVSSRSPSPTVVLSLVKGRYGTSPDRVSPRPFAVRPSLCLLEVKKAGDYVSQRRGGNAPVLRRVTVTKPSRSCFLCRGHLPRFGPWPAVTFNIRCETRLGGFAAKPDYLLHLTLWASYKLCYTERRFPSNTYAVRIGYPANSWLFFIRKHSFAGFAAERSRCRLTDIEDAIKLVGSRLLPREPKSSSYGQGVITPICYGHYLSHHPKGHSYKPNYRNLATSVVTWQHPPLLNKEFCSGRPSRTRRHSVPLARPICHP